MDCRKVRERAPLAVGGDLDVAEQRAFERHVASCHACYRELRGWQDAMRRLDPLRPPARFPAPAGLLDDILAAARSGAPGPSAAYGAPSGLRRLRRTAGFVAAAAAVAVLGLAGLRLAGVPAPGGKGATTSFYRLPPDQFGSPDGFILPVKHAAPAPGAGTRGLRPVGPVRARPTEQLPPALRWIGHDRDDF